MGMDGDLMAMIKWEGLEEFAEKLKALSKEEKKICNMSLYEGAAELADALNEEISGLKELNAVQRLGLHQGMGIAKFWEERGNTVTRVGFEGYNDIKTKRWPKGQPNVMIARSLIRGTSRLSANRFTRRAVKKARGPAIQAMRNKFFEEMEKTIGDYMK